MKHYLTEDSTLSCEEEVKSLRAKVEAQAKEIKRLVKVVVRAKYLISIVPDNDAWFEDAEAAMRGGEG